MNFRVMKDYPKLRPLVLAIFTDVLGMSIILPLLPILAIQFNINTFFLGFLISSNAIFGLVASPLFGKWSDKYGRKPMLLICQGGTLIGFFIFAFSDSLFTLLIARVIDGIFSGQLAISQAIVVDLVPPRDRGKQMTTIGGAFTLAYIFGPSIGGLAYEIWGIFGLGMLAVVISTCNVGFTATCLPETAPKKGTLRPSLATQQNPSVGENQSVSNDPLQQGASVSEKAEPFTSFLNPRTIYLLILCGFFILTAATFETTISLFSHIHFQLSVLQIGFLFTTMATFQVLFRTFVFSRIHSKLGDANCITLGFGIYMTAYILLLFGRIFLIYLPIMWYLTLGAVFTRGILVSFTSQTVDPQVQGRLNGIISAIDSGGQIAGPFIGTYLLLEKGIPMFLVVLISFALVSLMMSLRLFKIGFDTDPGGTGGLS